MIPGDITKPLAHDSFKSTLAAYSIGVQKQPRFGIDTLHMCPALHTTSEMKCIIRSRIARADMLQSLSFF